MMRRTRSTHHDLGFILFRTVRDVILHMHLNQEHHPFVFTPQSRNHSPAK